MNKIWYTYILTNRKYGTLYIGVTSNLEHRIQQHRAQTYSWFTKKYNISQLVWFQEFSSIQEAILYEKKIKWRIRNRKIQLIEQDNPERKNLL